MGREWGGRRGGAAEGNESGDIEMALGWTRHAQLGIIKAEIVSAESGRN